MGSSLVKSGNKGQRNQAQIILKLHTPNSLYPLTAEFFCAEFPCVEKKHLSSEHSIESQMASLENPMLCSENVNKMN